MGLSLFLLVRLRLEVVAQADEVTGGLEGAVVRLVEVEQAHLVASEEVQADILDVDTAHGAKVETVEVAVVAVPVVGVRRGVSGNRFSVFDCALSGQGEGNHGADEGGDLQVVAQSDAIAHCERYLDEELGVFGGPSGRGEGYRFAPHVVTSLYTGSEVQTVLEVEGVEHAGEEAVVVLRKAAVGEGFRRIAETDAHLCLGIAGNKHGGYESHDGDDLFHVVKCLVGLIC